MKRRLYAAVPQPQPAITRLTRQSDYTVFSRLGRSDVDSGESSVFTGQYRESVYAKIAHKPRRTMSFPGKGGPKAEYTRTLYKACATAAGITDPERNVSQPSTKLSVTHISKRVPKCSRTMRFVACVKGKSEKK